jgi:hypothetical protein
MSEAEERSRSDEARIEEEIRFHTPRRDAVACAP